jgi:nucleotide-binding universal stress UspA family protein
LIDEANDSLKGIAIPVVTAALIGEASIAIFAYQKENMVDTIAMGAFSHGKVHGFFFGSFTTRMLLETDANFILVR